MEALRAELAERVESGDSVFETIYLGGGTPTVLPLPLLELAGRLAGSEAGSRRASSQSKPTRAPSTPLCWAGWRQPG